MIGQWISSLQPTSKSKVVCTHYCVLQNRLSTQSYYIIKNIINSILKEVPEILNYFKLLDIDLRTDIFLNSSGTLKRDHTETFVRFVRKLAEIKLDYNIVIYISQI